MKYPSHTRTLRLQPEAVHRALLPQLKPSDTVDTFEQIKGTLHVSSQFIGSIAMSSVTQ